jgi:hypothetical protein
MPQYFFHTQDGVRFTDDEETSLADLTAARDEAVKIMAQLVEHEPSAFWETGSFSVTVTDERGLILLTLDLSGTYSPAVRRNKGQNVAALRDGPTKTR